MILVQQTFLACFSLIITFFAIKSDATKTTSKIIGFSYKTRLIENYYTSGSSSFIFGTCDPHQRSWQRWCSFAIQTKKVADSLDHVKICEFRLKANPKEFIGQILDVHSFGNDKAIITYRGNFDFIRFGVLNFSNCEAVVSKIDANLHLQSGTVLTTDDEVFDIIERKFEKSCGHFGYSKMILDSEGNVVTGLKEWLCNGKPLILGGVHSPLKGNLLVDAPSILHRNVRVIEVNENVTILKEYSNHESFASTVAVSNTEERLSICYQINLLNFNCSQYDYNGELQFETSFEFQHPTGSVNLYNLPNGEFLLLAMESIRDNEIKLSKTQPNSLIVMKINGQGKLVKIVELPEEFNHTLDFTKVHFHVDEYNKYCFSYVLDSFLDQSDKLVTLTVACLDDSSLIFSK